MKLNLKIIDKDKVRKNKEYDNDFLLTILGDTKDVNSLGSVTTLIHGNFNAEQFFLSLIYMMRHVAEKANFDFEDLAKSFIHYLEGNEFEDFSDEKDMREYMKSYVAEAVDELLDSRIAESYRNEIDTEVRAKIDEYSFNMEELKLERTERYITLAEMLEREVNELVLLTLVDLVNYSY